MFSMKSGQKLPSVRDAQNWWSGRKGRSIIKLLSSQEAIPTLTSKDALLPHSITLASPGFPEKDSIHNALDRFMDHGNSLLFEVDFAAQLPPNQIMAHKNIPVNDLRRICLGIFTEDIRCVKFDYALDGIDYLWDYECTRRQRMQETARKLGINKGNYSRVLRERRDLVDLIIALEHMEGSVDHYLATVYLGLRIWTMVNALQSEPFDKPNVFTMLNTLFPPALKTTLSNRISLKEMHYWRAKLFSYVAAVERDGKQVMNMFIDGVEKREECRWKDVHRRLELYLHDADFIWVELTRIDGQLKNTLGDRLPTELRTVSTYVPFHEGSFTGSSNTSMAYPPFNTGEVDLASGVFGNAEVLKMQHNGRKYGHLANSLEVMTREEYTSYLAKNRRKIQSVEASPSIPVGFPTSRPASRASTLPIPQTHKFANAIRALRNFSFPRAEITPQLSPLPRELSWSGKWVIVIDQGGRREIEWLSAFELTPSTFATPAIAPDSAKTLRSDNFEFLNHPYEDPFPDLPHKLRKKFSAPSLFSRSRNGSSTSLSTDCDRANGLSSRSTSFFSRSRKSSSTSLRADYNDENALAITIHPNESTATLSHPAKLHQIHQGPKLPEGRASEYQQAPSTSSLKARQSDIGVLNDKQAVKTPRKASSFRALFARNQSAEAVGSVMSLQEVSKAREVGRRRPPRLNEDEIPLIPLRSMARPSRASSFGQIGEPLQKIPTLESLISAEDSSQKLPLPPNFNALSSTYNVEFAASNPDFYQPGKPQAPPNRPTERDRSKNRSRPSPHANNQSSNPSTFPEVMPERADRRRDSNGAGDQRLAGERRMGGEQQMGRVQTARNISTARNGFESLVASHLEQQAERERFRMAYLPPINEQQTVRDGLADLEELPYVRRDRDVRRTVADGLAELEEARAERTERAQQKSSGERMPGERTSVPFGTESR